jgi:hypothetical protein
MSIVSISSAPDDAVIMFPMTDNSALPAELADFRRLVQRVLEGGIPRGLDFDACRAVLDAEPSGEEGFVALCVLLEGALADPKLDSGETQVLVPLLKQLARGTVRVEDLL